MNESVVSWLNELPQEDAEQEFRKCCGASWWCDKMATGGPFSDSAALRAEADRALDAMPRAAWLEAFGSHPKIGDLESLRMRLIGNRQ